MPCRAINLRVLRSVPCQGVPAVVLNKEQIKKLAWDMHNAGHGQEEFRAHLAVVVLSVCAGPCVGSGYAFCYALVRRIVRTLKSEN